jgi:galactokinase
MNFGLTSIGSIGPALNAGEARRAEQVANRFQELYGETCRIFHAPGRVNLIGEHTDYNDGFVMPAAINLSCWVAIAPADNRTIQVHSVNLKESRVFDLDRPRRLGEWSDYVQGVAIMLERSGYRLPGAKMLVWSEVPIGSGLSSSAALEIAAGLALLETQPSPCERSRLALACQRAENEFVGARCGIMDQFISSQGKAGHALMLDCRSLEPRFISFPADLCLVICNSLVKHDIAAGEYNRRRAECEEGVRLLSAKIPSLVSLRDLSLSELDRFRELLPPTIYKRCRHVVSETGRVVAAAAALEGNELPRLGELMAESHCSLRDQYEVSCPELDLLVEVARQTQGVHGARMTGGGFGGCTVNVVSKKASAQVAETIARRYKAQTGQSPEIYISPVSQGAERWESQA